MHRVTYRSRVLPEFPSTTAPSLEKSNDRTGYHEPLATINARTLCTEQDECWLHDAVRDAIATYLQTSAHTPDIINRCGSISSSRDRVAIARFTETNRSTGEAPSSALTFVD
jgi:hypothetical protein